MNRTVPSALWVAIIALAGISCIQITLGLSQRHAPIILGVAANLVLMYGLYAGHRWAYVVTLLFAILGTVVAFLRQPAAGLAVAAVTCVVVVPVLLSGEYFWGRGGGFSRDADPGCCATNAGSTLPPPTAARYCARCGRDLTGPPSIGCPACSGT